MILKRSGVKKLFERQKIEKAITTALHKRNKTDNQVNELINRVILEIENSNLREISTRKIGDIIMRELADFDEVAYIRFASVYKDFNKASDFAVFAGKLKK
jgi:transcriptional repressor NrdR